MATELKRIEIGFVGGQVVTVRISDGSLGGLRRSIESDDGWYDLETEDGTVALQLDKVIFIRIAGAPHTIGFSDS